ncbi:hypothetical protein PAZH1_285 [Pseudomonas phage PA_ZH1]|nr:hypothetical protein PAZH1_285 [Pseudomonas phage PA_ZH1]
MYTTGIFQYGILLTRTILDRNILTDMFVLYSRITEPKEDF